MEKQSPVRGSWPGSLAGFSVPGALPLPGPARCWLQGTTCFFPACGSPLPRHSGQPQRAARGRASGHRSLECQWLRGLPRPAAEICPPALPAAPQGRKGLGAGRVSLRQLPRALSPGRRGQVMGAGGCTEGPRGAQKLGRWPGSRWVRGNSSAASRPSALGRHGAGQAGSQSEPGGLCPSQASAQPAPPGTGWQPGPWVPLMTGACHSLAPPGQRSRPRGRLLTSSGQCLGLQRTMWPHLLPCSAD